jgi:integrase
MSKGKLGWEDYPLPRVVPVKGKLYVEVSIPRAIRHLFGSGQGGVTNRRRSTGTTDPALAEKKKMSLAHEIFKEFDIKQADAEEHETTQYDDFARKAITDLAKALKYNRGAIPALDPSTKYSDLAQMKSRLDEAVKINADDIPDRANRSIAALKIANNARHSGVAFEAVPSEMIADLPNHVQAITTKTTDDEVSQKIQDARFEEDDAFNSKKHFLLEAYSSSIVVSFWRDLLMKAASEQQLAEPVFDQVDGADFVVINGSFHPKEKMLAASKMVFGKEVTFTDAKRKQQVQSVKRLSVSDVREEYEVYVKRRYNKTNTQRKWIRAVDRFIEMVGDFSLNEIRPLQAYQFADAQEAANPSVSNKSITNYHAGMLLLLGYCVRKGYIDLNPFNNVSVKKYGRTSKSWLPYTSYEMERIFSHDWAPQERLFLSIVSATGMRSTEVGSLTWERFNVDSATGIRTFSLVDTYDEAVDVKNEGSARHIPLHPALLLPAKRQGRVFDYTIDPNGLSSTAIGHIILPTLNKLVPHTRKSIHSFRRTLKVLMRNAGVSKEVNDMYTGHGEGDVSSKSYGGVSVEARFEAISKVPMPWLDP